MSPQERKALLGLLGIGLFVAGSVYEIGKRNFWFEPKNVYYTHVKDADGLRIGGLVTLSGLRVGEVKALDVENDNRIKVTLSVKRDVASRLRGDSVATVFRAFVIGEKRIDLVPGSDALPVLEDQGVLPGREPSDLLQLMSGKKMGEIIEQLDHLTLGLNGIVSETNKVLEKYRGGSFDKTFTLVNPALENFMALSDDLIVMTKELKKKSKTMPLIVDEGVSVLGKVRADFLDTGLARHAVANLNSVAQPLAERQKLIASLLGNLEDLSRDLARNPDYTKEVLGAVNELTVTLKALQKTWFLSDHADEARATHGKGKGKTKGNPGKTAE